MEDNFPASQSVSLLRGRCMSPPIPCGDVKLKSEDNIVPICTIGSSTRQYKGYVSRRRHLTTLEEQGKLPTLSPLYSLIYDYVHDSNECLRDIYADTHLPHRRTNVVLRDPNGKAWVVVYSPSSRDLLSGGWSAFTRGNNLEEGDYCVFKLVGPVECVSTFSGWLWRS